MTSVVQTEPAETAAAGEDHAEAHAHPSDWEYIKVALVLAVLTALEVFTYFESVHKLGRMALVVSLMVMMVAKIAIVVAWFMHLKFDSKLFSRMFIAGVLLALGVYTVMLTTFVFFWN